MDSLLTGKFNIQTNGGKVRDLPCWTSTQPFDATASNVRTLNGAICKSIKMYQM